MLDEMINNFQKQLKEINEKLDILNEQNDEIKILSTTDVMEILEINRNTANELFKREDFPKIPGIKSNKVEKVAFQKWLQLSNIDISKERR